MSFTAVNIAVGGTSDEWRAYTIEIKPAVTAISGALTSVCSVNAALAAEPPPGGVFDAAVSVSISITAALTQPVELHAIPLDGSSTTTELFPGALDTGSNVAYGNGVWVVSRTTASSLYRSTDNGASWSTINLTSITSGRIEGIIYAGGQFVGIVYDSLVSGVTKDLATSPDGLTWTLRTGPAFRGRSNIAYNGAVYVVADLIWNNGAQALAAASTDGHTWVDCGGLPLFQSWKPLLGNPGNKSFFAYDDFSQYSTTYTGANVTTTAGVTFTYDENLNPLIGTIQSYLYGSTGKYFEARGSGTGMVLMGVGPFGSTEVKGLPPGYTITGLAWDGTFLIGHAFSNVAGQPIYTLAVRPVGGPLVFTPTSLNTGTLFQGVRIGAQGDNLVFMSVLPHGRLVKAVINTSPSIVTANATLTSLGAALTGSLSSAGAATAALTTSIRLSSSVQTSSTATAGLTTSILLGATVAVVTTSTPTLTDLPAGAVLAAIATAESIATAAITTAIRLNAVAASETVVSGADLATQIKVTASIAAATSASAALTTQIQLSAPAFVSATTSAALTAQVQLVTAASTAVDATAELTTQVLLACDAASLAIATAALSTEIQTAADISVATAASGDLTTQISLDATISTQTTTDAVLSAPRIHALVAAVSTGATTTGELSAAIKLAAHASVAASTDGALITDIVLAGAISVVGTAVVDLLVISLDLTPETRRTILVQANPRVYVVPADTRLQTYLLLQA